MSTAPAWLPTRYTPPLGEQLVTDGDRLISVAEAVWTLPDDTRLELDEWQRWLLRHVLERYPADWPDEQLRGRLRYRQVVISMGRQNGKSLLGALFGFYGLAMHDPGPEVIGIASTTDQANIVYGRVKHAIQSNGSLSRRFKPTGTRGITARVGAGRYVVKPAKSDALQGIPVSVCLFDELHISKPELWAAVVNGQRTRTNGLLVGITTAGDDDSALLKRLYKLGDQAMAGEAERFGFFCWEAPDGSSIDTPGAIEAANPAVACGRVNVADVREDVRLLPVSDQERYTLNRWVSSSSSWLPIAAWNAGERGTAPDLEAGSVVYTIERTRSWEHGCIVATSKSDDGRLWTELVASIVRPNLDQLERLCEQLNSRRRGVFAVDSMRLGALERRLKERGYETRLLRLGDQLQAGPAAYSLIVAGRVSHPGDPLTGEQMPRAKRKNNGDGWRLSEAESGGDIDAVRATVAGLYSADAVRDPGIQIF